MMPEEIFAGKSLARILADAENIRERIFGNKIGLCAIINIRNGNCGMDCKFCAQSGYYGRTGAAHRLLANEELGRKIAELNTLPVAHIGLVASGHALTGAEFDRLCQFVASLPENIRSKICVSLGHLSGTQFGMLKDCGITHYHHNLETSEKFYPSICSTQTWNERLNTVKKAIKAGFQLCCGGLFGLGESWQDRLDFAMSLREAGIVDIPLNFLQPIPGTPLGRRDPLGADEALKIIALFRNVLPEATLRICGGRPITFGNRQAEIFQAGANALMTGNYLTTNGIFFENDMAMIKNLGLELC